MCFQDTLNLCLRTFLVVQWLSLCAPNAEGLGLIPCQGTRSHMSHGMIKKEKILNFLKRYLKYTTLNLPS